MSTSRRMVPDSNLAAIPRVRALRWRLLSVVFSLALTVGLLPICVGLGRLLLPQGTVRTLQQRES